MRILKLELNSYRGFEQATFEFDPHLTVLAGVNGSGKSSVLECIATLLADKVHYFLTGESRDFPTLLPGDLRVGTSHAQCTVTISRPPQHGGHVSVVGRFPERVPFRSHSAPIKLIVENTMVRSQMWVLPGFFYTVDRTLAGDEVPAEPDAPARRPITDAEQIEQDVRDALTGALTPRSTRFGPFLAWFREREDLENEERIRRRSFEYEDRQLSAVRRAIQGMLPGFSTPSVHRASRTLVVRKGDTELALNQLSDGERCMFAMVGDLARRLAQVDPWSDDPLAVEAVVMIDEIELHLHPSWQRSVLGRLRATFPNCQFIVTTHSPQVLSEVPTHSVILLEDFKPRAPSVAIEGRDSNAILADVMRVPERPESTLALIRRVGDLIDRDQLAEARAELERLAEVVSHQDSEVVRLGALIDFLGGNGRAVHSEGH